MKTFETFSQFHITELKNLSPHDVSLVLTAKQEQDKAQALYSGYRVGAAVLDQFDDISFGVNVERRTLTQTTHAEQNAIDTMVAKYGYRAIEAVAICAITEEKSFSIDDLELKDLIFPCGHCLSIIWEQCLGEDTMIFSYLGNNLVAMATIASLYPRPFGFHGLKKLKK